MPSSGLIGEIPGPHVTWFEADEEIIAGSLRVGGSGLAAKVARRDPLHRVTHSRGDQPGAAAELDSAIGRRVLADHDAGPWIPP